MSTPPRRPPRALSGLEATLVHALAEGDGAFVALRPMYCDLAGGDDRPNVPAGILLGLIASCYTPATGSGPGEIWARVFYQDHLWVALSKEYIWSRTRLSDDQVARATEVLRARNLVATCLRRFGKGPRTHYRLTETFLARRAAWLAAAAQAAGYGDREAEPGAEGAAEAGNGREPDAPRYPGKWINGKVDKRETPETFSGKVDKRFPGNPENFIRLFLDSNKPREEFLPLSQEAARARWPDPLRAWQEVVDLAAALSGQSDGTFSHAAMLGASAAWATDESDGARLRVVLGRRAGPHWLSRAERYLDQARGDFGLEIFSPLPVA